MPDPTARPYALDHLTEYGPEDDWMIFYRCESDSDDYHRWYYGIVTGVEVATTGEPVPFGDRDPFWLAHGEAVQALVDERAAEPPDPWD